MYTYQITIKRWIDGDTVEASVDLGFGVYTIVRFRLIDLDTPEKGQDNFVEARIFCEKEYPVGSEFVSQTIKSKDKYGRWLVSLPTLKEKLEKANLLKKV